MRKNINVLESTSLILFYRHFSFGLILLLQIIFKPIIKSDAEGNQKYKNKHKNFGVLIPKITARPVKDKSNQFSEKPCKYFVNEI